MWDLIVSVPDHCLSFYFSNLFIIYIIYLSFYSLALTSWRAFLIGLSPASVCPSICL